MTPWTGYQSVTRPLPTQNNKNTILKSINTSIPRVGIEPMIPDFERAKRVLALDCTTTTVISCHWIWGCIMLVDRQYLPPVSSHLMQELAKTQFLIYVTSVIVWCFQCSRCFSSDFISLLFSLKKSRVMRTACCLCVCVSPDIKF
jgi:hypothetical protein